MRFWKNILWTNDCGKEYMICWYFAVLMWGDSKKLNNFNLKILIGDTIYFFTLLIRPGLIRGAIKFDFCLRILTKVLMINRRFLCNLLTSGLSIYERFRLLDHLIWYCCSWYCFTPATHVDVCFHCELNEELMSLLYLIRKYYMCVIIMFNSFIDICVSDFQSDHNLLMSAVESYNGSW